MHWPGDGKGPLRTPCLASPCDLTTIQAMLQNISIGCLLTALICFFTVQGYRRLAYNSMRLNSLKLIFRENDFVFKEEDEDFQLTRRSSLRSSQAHLDSISDLNVNASLQTLLSTRPLSACKLSSGEDTLEHMYRKSIAYLNDDAVFIKKLSITKMVIRSKVAAYLAGLREIRHENINSFIGCYITPNTCNLVFEYCYRGSLQDVIHNKSNILDWDLKLSLMTDFVKGMEYLHGTCHKAHGRLKSTNCLVNSRWVLKITDFGIQNLYILTGGSLPIKLKDKVWMAPELLHDESKAELGTRHGDVYTFAIIMHMVFYQTEPYGPEHHSAEEIVERVAAGEDPPFRPNIVNGDVPQAYLEILKQCWDENPGIRPSFKELSERIHHLAKGKKSNIVEHMFKMMDEYSSQLEARMEDLELEERRKELLISRILPPFVAESLKAGIAVAPETYDEVSIYFSDIVGFTTISAMSTSMQVVDLLNDLYTIFDQTIASYDVYKVETIGDAYMVTSGLPVRNGRRHAGEVAMTALDLLSACGNFTIKHLPDFPLRLRIGLHSGPCVAGVVGLTMPRYCLFGDTVNQAHKMESSGAGSSLCCFWINAPKSIEFNSMLEPAFRVHISQQVKEILDELGGYHTKYRGPIEFDGGFKTSSYWLISCDSFHKPLPEPPPLVGLDSVYPVAAKPLPKHTKICIVFFIFAILS
ncbi:hypothetical protein Aperf_G00000107787 [Anoplocephala perfoliata]